MAWADGIGARQCLVPCRAAPPQGGGKAAIRKVIRQVSMEEIGKKPEVTVIISRLAAE